MDESFAVRLNRALELRNIKPIELAEKSGVQKSAISQYLSGLYEPKQRNLDRLAIALNVNPAWLMGHNVPIERNSFINNTIDITGLDNTDIANINEYIKMYKLAKAAKNKKGEK